VVNAIYDTVGQLLGDIIARKAEGKLVAGDIIKRSAERSAAA
jgi:hypothetical protein